MRVPSYLVKSRHGIFYFRQALPSALLKGVRRRREFRVSLGTRDRREALLLARKWSVMLSELYPWEQEAALDLHRYKQGKDLIRRFGKIDLNNRFEVSQLSEHLSNDEFECYVFALEHDNSLQQNGSTQDARALAAALAPLINAFPERTPARFEGIEAKVEPAPQTSLGDLVQSFTASKTKSLSTPKSYAHKLNIFIRFIEESQKGPATVEGLSPAIMRDYADFIRKLPTRLEFSGDGCIHKLVENTVAKIIAPKTIQSHFGAVRCFLRWIEHRQYSGLRPNLYGILEFDKSNIAEKQRLPMSPTDITTIFGCDNYRQGTFKRAIDFWVPLLGIHTGARAGELCQLATNDVFRNEEGMWVFDFNIFGPGGKRLKVRESGARIVPVHKALRDLGFLDYVGEMRVKGEEILFPDEVRDEVGHFGAFSKRVNNFIRRCGVEPPLHAMKDFHSFRHNVSSFLIGQGCEEYIVNAILGHSQAGRSESVRTYSSGPGLRQLDKWMQKMDFGIQYSGIRKNGWRRQLTDPAAR